MKLRNLTRAIDLEASFIILRRGSYPDTEGREKAKRTFLRMRIDEERALHYWKTGEWRESIEQED